MSRRTRTSGFDNAEELRKSLANLKEASAKSEDYRFVASPDGISMRGGSMVDLVFGKRRGRNAAKTAPRGEGFNRFWHLRVPDGVAPDDGCLTLEISPGQPGNGVVLTPGRYKLTNEFAKFLFDSDAAITTLGIHREGTDVYARLVPENLCLGTEEAMRKPNGDIMYK